MFLDLWKDRRINCGVYVLRSLPLASLDIMSRKRESKYRNEKKFPFLDSAMVTELMSTTLPFAFHFVSLRFVPMVSLFCSLC